MLKKVASILHLALLLAVSAACATRGTATTASTEANEPRSANSAAETPPVEARSLLGTPLLRPVPREPGRSQMEAQLDSARQKLAADPTNADALIWVGRRLAYLGRYNDAVDVFSRGIREHPRDARFFRHRGHRYITLRRLDAAVADFQRAAQLIAGTEDEIEPDGMPNPLGIPTSTLHFNIWYHLGLAHYLRGDLEGALDAYQRCMAVSTNPDAIVATVHWKYMTLRLLGRDAQAHKLLDRVSREMEVIENHAYHRLILLYRGELPVDSIWHADAGASVEDVTTAYGVANWHIYNGRATAGVDLLRAIITRGQWPAFGHIAAEADLARR